MSFLSPPRLEVCFSPAMLHLFDTTDTVVVIIDVFRATSTIAAALDNGASGVIPVSSVDDCISIGKNTPNSITAGERNGQVAQGLSYGNSPLEYPPSFVNGKTLVLTTTNGTRLLHMVTDPADIITGSFLNLSAVINFLRLAGKNVLLGCAGWKDRFNLEDALFAGAVAAALKEDFQISCDSAQTAIHLWRQAEGGILDFLKDSAHYHRLSSLGLQKDLEYCTTKDLHPVLPILCGQTLVVEK